MVTRKEGKEGDRGECDPRYVVTVGKTGVGVGVVGEKRRCPGPLNGKGDDPSKGGTKELSDHRIVTGVFPEGTRSTEGKTVKRPQDPLYMV